MAYDWFGPQCWVVPGKGNTVNTSNHTILQVDDDPNDVLLMQRAFRKAKLGHSLHVARDGEEAIEYLTHQGRFTDASRYPPPTLMLLDLKMPRRNGFETLQWLRQQPGLKRIIVIVFSSSNEMADINRAYDLGANSYLVKPGIFEALVGLVNALAGYWLGINEKPELYDGPPAARNKLCVEAQPA